MTSLIKVMKTPVYIGDYLIKTDKYISVIAVKNSKKIGEFVVGGDSLSYYQKNHPEYELIGPLCDSKGRSFYMKNSFPECTVVRLDHLEIDDMRVLLDAGVVDDRLLELSNETRTTTLSGLLDDFDELENCVDVVKIEFALNHKTPDFPHFTNKNRYLFKVLVVRIYIDGQGDVLDYHKIFKKLSDMFPKPKDEHHGCWVQVDDSKVATTNNFIIKLHVHPDSYYA